jgi:UPF0755 protein
VTTPFDQDDAKVIEAPAGQPEPVGHRRRRAFAGDQGPAADDEYELLRPEWSLGRKVLVTVLGVGVVIALLAGITGFWAYRQLHPTGGAHREVLVDVPTGSSTGTIADLLESKGVTGNSFVFKAYVSWKSAGPFQAGQYKFATNSDADEAIRVLKAGPLPPPSKRFTVAPGLNLRQIPAKVVSQIPAFSVDKLTQLMAGNQIRSQFQPPDEGLEGFLFPDTYDIGEGADESVVLQHMVAQFDKVATEAGLAESQATAGLDPYKVVIVASLIEREAKVDADRAKIARVIYNRLNQKMALGVDATLCYLKDQVPCVLTQSDLAKDTPYNTRTKTGLPPTPISNISQASLLAALHPDDGPWLYYVLDPQVDPSGQQHFFTDDSRAFDQAKARCKSAGFGCD